LSAGHSIHAGGNNLSNISTWRLHGYTRSVLALALAGYYIGKEPKKLYKLYVECTVVKPDSTAFPGQNAQLISGVDVGDGSPMTEEELEVFMADHLGIIKPT
jgi:hypothetical protein